MLVSQWVYQLSEQISTLGIWVSQFMTSSHLYFNHSNRPPTGTFFAKNGGKYGEVSVALFNWVFRGDIAGKAMWTDPNSSGSMASKGWNVTYRNFDG